MKRKLIFASLLGLGFLAACGESQDELTATTPVPTSLHFADVKQILDRHCTQCHSGPNAAEGISYENFSKAVGQMDRSLTAIKDKSMPPGGSGGPTAYEIKIIEAWLDAGKPE